MCRMKKAASLLCVLLLVVGCAPVLPENPEGLTAGDFELISLSGFDPEDHAVDKNDYAWAMAHFVPDGQEAGHVYVGTGNDMIGLIYQGISAVMGTGELGDILVLPPEIRRYRPDIGTTHWERVFDYRDVEDEGEFRTIGFRYMTTYRTAYDGVNYLYAATMGEQAKLWRTSTGEPGEWELAWDSGAVGSVRWMEIHRGILYLALANEVPTGEQIGKIWATDGNEFWPVMEDGFGNPKNTGVMFLASYNDWLYAGTYNTAEGYEIWKLEGPDNDTAPRLIVAGGGPSSANEAAITPCVFDDQLYIGSQLNPYANLSRGLKGADIIRINSEDEWEIVVGPDSLTGLNSGFNNWPNTYIWSMIVHDDWFYVATYNQVSAFFNVLENLDKVIAAFLPKPGSRSMRRANFFEIIWYAGADMYKTQDALTWYRVTNNGFGNVGNYGIRTMVSVGDELYVGTTNPFDGLEIWRANSSP